MRVLITQPVQDAAAVAATLHARGHHAFTIPVVDVERTAPPAVKLEGAQGFIVTSPDGARALADTIGVRTFPVFADSGVTASELTRLGFKNVKAAKDDSADLAKLVEKSANPNYGAFIYACSTSAPVQLSALLSTMGFAIRSLPLYSVKRVDHVPSELHKILKDGGVDVALFLSADEARAVVTLIQREELEPLVHKLKTVAANPVVTAPLRALKLGAVVVPPAGDLETVFGALDQKLVDKVEEERLEREQLAREATERQRAEDERRAKEQAEQERVERERAEKKRTEQEHIAAERAERERAAREKAERDRLAKEKGTAEKAEHKRVAKENAAQKKAARKQAERERAAQAKAEKERLAREHDEQKRAEKERAAKEKEERERAAQEKERERIARERMEQERVERDRSTADAAEHERTEREKAEEGHRAAEEAERGRQGEERIAAEEAARKRNEQEKAEQREAARKKAERERQEAESVEHQRLAAEAAERKRIKKEKKEKAGREKAELERRAAEKNQRKKTEIERIERERAEAVAAEKRRQEAKAATREEQEKVLKADEPSVADEADTVAPPAPGLGGKLLSWISRRSAPEPAHPMFTSFQDKHVPETLPEADVAKQVPSATMPPPVAVTTAAPVPEASREPPMQRADRTGPPQSEDIQKVSQEQSPKPVDEASPPKDALSKSSTTPLRAGGRAELLRAEDAADQRARQQRYKNFGIGDAPGEIAAGTIDQSAIQTAAAKSSSAVGRVVGLFIMLVVMATAVIGTASWWVPRVTQFVQGTGAPGQGTPEQPAQSAQISAAPGPEPGIATAPSPAAPTGIESLRVRFEALERNMASTANSETMSAVDAGLSKRLRVLEQGGGFDDASVASLSESLSSQARQLAAVSARLATLEAAIGNAARLEDLNNRITILEGKSADAASVLFLSDRVTAVEETSRRAVAEQTAEVALLMATAQLREAVVAGRPFATELETTKALSARVLDTTIDDSGFAVYAARGMPSLTALQRRFDETAAQVVRTAAIPDGASGWLRQSLDRLMSIITVRRVDGTVAGNSASAGLARAENRLVTGDIVGATVEMTALTGAAAEAAAPWLADARARVAADRAVNATLGKAMALMAMEERAQTPAATSVNVGE